MRAAALRVSLAINVLLAGLAIVLGWQALQSSDARDAESNLQAAATGPEEQPEDASLLSQLRSCDIPEKTAKQLFALQLLDSIHPSTPEEYWTPRAIRDSKRQMAEFAAVEQVRARILRIEGQSAVDDEAFRRLFRPLDSELHFLSSAKQIEVQRLRTDALRRRVELLASGAPPNQQLQIRRDFEASLQQVLTADELFEYQLRESPVAQTLLTGGFQFEEGEFRKVFAAIAEAVGPKALMSGAVSPANPVVTSAIRAELGDARYREYQNAKAPISSIASTGVPTRLMRDGARNTGNE